MKILNAKVNWNTTCANWPELEIEVDSLPEPIYKKIPSGNDFHYISIIDGIVRYLSGNPDVPTHGFGGSEINLTLEDGTTETLHGGWSSRAGLVNILQDQQIVDVVVIPRDKGYRLAMGITLEMAQEAAKMCDAYLVKDNPWDDEIYYVPSISPDKIEKKYPQCPYFEGGCCARQLCDRHPEEDAGVVVSGCRYIR